MPQPVTPPPRSHDLDFDVDGLEFTPSPASKQGSHFPPRRPRPKKTPQTQTKHEMAPRTPPEDGTPTSISYTGTMLRPLYLIELGDYISLYDLHRKVGRANARKLPGPPSPELRDMLIREATAPWGQCVLTYLANVKLAVVDLLTALCNEHFGRFRQSGLHGLVKYTYYGLLRKADFRKIANDVLKELVHQTESAISEQVLMERRPFTQDENEEELTTVSSSLHCKILAYRRGVSSNQLTGPEYTVELELISQVLAYAKLAYKRFGDYIPMRVEQTLLVPLDTKLDLQFQKRIFEGDDVEERCRTLVEDAPELVEMRREMMGKLEVLRRAELEVSKFQV